MTTAEVTPFARTLDHELLAVLRGVSLECPVCSEFLLHRAAGTVCCPECGLELGRRIAAPLHGSRAKSA